MDEVEKPKEGSSMTIRELKGIMVQYKGEVEERIPQLARIRNDAEHLSYDDHMLGFAKGYSKALEEILAKIK